MRYIKVLAGLHRMAAISSAVVDKILGKHERETSDGITTTVTTALCQFNSGEDVVPAFLESDTHMALMVGDGHGGKETTTCLTTNSQAILTEALVNGLETAMAKSQSLCKEFDDGAMLAIARYEFKSRILQVISVGDCSCSVYQNSSLVHEQPHRDVDTFLKEHPDGSASGTDVDGNGGTVVVNMTNADGSVLAPVFNPQPDGVNMKCPRKPYYFSFKINGEFLTQRHSGTRRKLASSSFVGHKGWPRQPPCLTTFPVPDGPFHIVMTSDGVSDVMHPADGFLKDSEVVAYDILQEAKQRWTENRWTIHYEDADTGQVTLYPNNKMCGHSKTITTDKFGRYVQAYRILRNGYYRITYPDGEIRTVAEIVEKNRGADDISVLVFKCE